MKKKTKIINMPVIIEQDKDGFFASCPSLQGCYTQGGTYSEAIKNIKDAVKLCIEDERTFSVPLNISLTSIEVKV